VNLPGETGIAVPCGEVKPGVRTDKINFLTISCKTGFTVLDYAVLTGYMLVMLGIGFLFMRQTVAGDFFLGGGRLPWWAVGISIFATTLSAITFLSMPAKAFAADWRMFLYNFGILMVAPVIIRYYLPYFRNLNLETAYDYLERRFNRLVRYIASGLFITFMVSRIALVLYLPSLALNVATGIDIYFCIAAMSLVTIIYCTMGGMKAVVWSDVVQGFLLIGGAVLSLAVLIGYSNGGFFGFVQSGYEMGKLHLFDFRFDLTQPVFWLVILGAFSNQLITYSSDQSVVQRYMCTADQKQAIRSIWLNAGLAIPVTLIFFMIGTALFTYYRSNPEWLDAGLRNPDAIYPFFIVNGLPPGISGLVVAAIFAAAMSTLSANINSSSAAIYADFLKIRFPEFSNRYPVVLPQMIGIGVGIIGTTFALFMATYDIQSIWDLFNTFLGLFTGPVGGLFFMGVFSKRINGTGAVAGLLGSAMIVGFVQTSTEISFLLYGLLGMVSCYIIGYIVSLFFGGSAKIIVS
jgi:SSS family transporter